MKLVQPTSYSTDKKSKSAHLLPQQLFLRKNSPAVNQNLQHLSTMVSQSERLFCIKSNIEWELLSFCQLISVNYSNGYTTTNSSRFVPLNLKYCALFGGEVGTSLCLWQKRGEKSTPIITSNKSCILKCDNKPIICIVASDHHSGLHLALLYKQ